MERNYGEKFRAERKRLGLRQEDVANQLGISSAALSLREKEERNFKVSDLYRAYVYFGIDIGFAQVFDYMVSHENPEFVEKFPKSIQETIKTKDYKNMTMAILEELKVLLSGEAETETNSNPTSDTEKESGKKIGENMTVEEKIKLKRILKKFQERDGNIMGAIKILEDAMP